MFDEEVFKGIVGWFTHTEARHLYDTAIEREGLVVELGSWLGKSTYALACAVRDSKKPPIIAVDRFTGSSEHRAGGREVWTFPQYYDTLKKAGVIPNHIITIIGDIVQTARLFANESVGLLFHDGSHEPDLVREDFRVWLPKVRKDGIVFVHDLTVGDVLKLSRDVGFELRHKDKMPTALNSFTRGS